MTRQKDSETLIAACAVLEKRKGLFARPLRWLLEREATKIAREEWAAMGWGKK